MNNYPPAKPNGTTPATDDKTKQLAETAAALGELTSLLIRSPELSQYRIADMDWLVVPAFVNRQFLIVRAPTPAEPIPMPSGALLWASLSSELDTLFRQNPGQRYQLTREQRTSGDCIWITDLVGDPRVWSTALDHLRTTAFKGRKVSMARKADDGTTSVVEHPPM